MTGNLSGARVEAEAPAAPAAASGQGIRISARIGALVVALVTTASDTYSRMGLGSVEAKVLLATERRPRRAARISARLDIHPSAISRAVASLQAKGLVERVEADGVRLTRPGASLRRRVSLIASERERRLFEGLSGEDRTILAGYLQRLAANIPALAELAGQSAETEEIAEDPL